jgi:hypothetical protein
VSSAVGTERGDAPSSKTIVNMLIRNVFKRHLSSGVVPL